MEPQKSSKKIYVLVVVLVLAIGIAIGGYLVLHSNFSLADINEEILKILEQEKQPVSGCQPNPDDKNKDSDNDGLMDWQENTWQTDPCIPDTDKDGYLDGEEVSSGYNPTKKAPDDKLAGNNSNEPRALPSNLTLLLTQNLAQSVIQGDMGFVLNASDLIPSTISNQVVNQAIQDTLAAALAEFSLPNISDQEIIVSSDNSKTAIKNYNKKISEAINQQKENIFADQDIDSRIETEIFYSAIKSRDFSEVNKYIELYSKAAEDIKKIPVPSDLVNIHKQEIGIFEVMTNIYRAVKGIDQDPLKTNVALEQYKVVQVLLNEMILELNEQAQRVK